jgi:hypothetical protein
MPASCRKKLLGNLAFLDRRLPRLELRRFGAVLFPYAHEAAALAELLQVGVSGSFFELSLCQLSHLGACAFCLQVRLPCVPDAFRSSQYSFADMKNCGFYYCDVSFAT